MSDQATHPLRGVRVLIVEDSWHVATALASLLTDIGMVVIGPISTIAEAEPLMAEQQPELAVVGLNLKGEMAFDLVDGLHERGCASSSSLATSARASSWRTPAPCCKNHTMRRSCWRPCAR